jgi:transcriptional regulator with XRE-family HTH domain
MPAPKGSQNAKGNRGGRPTLYKPDFAAQAAKACRAGFTDQELADLFGVAVSTISAWKAEHVEFSDALKAGKAEADDRVERALYHRAIGYSHEVEKPMVVDKDVRIVTYTERMPPDTTACIFWLKNRNPEEWRDKTQVEPSWAGKKPSEMTNEELDAAYLALLTLLPSPETVN